MRFARSWLFVLLGMSVALGACAGRQVVTHYDMLPDWASQGSGAYRGDQGMAFYGVGASQLRHVPQRMRQAAVGARTELARVYESRIDALQESFTETIAAEGGEVTDDLMMDVNRILTSVELTGVEIVDRFVDPRTSTEYALARLSVGDLQEFAASIPGVSERARQAVRDNTDEAIGRMDKLIKERDQ